jgi:hypothetical protein
MPMYAVGRIAKGQCQRCGLFYLLRELVMDGYYPNIRVCQGCYDPPQPQERLAVISDAVALYKPTPDAVSISPPLLVAQQIGTQVILTWSGFNRIPPPPPGQVLTDNFKPGQGKSPIGSSGSANITAGYLVNRSPDGVTWTQIANLTNTADEFGALSIETDTYTDTPGLGTWFYQVVGYDVLFGDTYG